VKELRIGELLFECAFGDGGERLIRISRFMGDVEEPHCSWEWPVGGAMLLAETALRLIADAPEFSGYIHHNHGYMNPKVRVDRFGVLFEDIGWSTRIGDWKDIQGIADFCDEFENGKVNPQAPSGREEPISA
jgi:hypothetical protein